MLYARLGAVRLFFTLLAPGVIVFPGLFVAASSVTPLLVHHGPMPEGESQTIARPAPIVFVIFDEFPTTSLMDGEERIDAGRYPNFAALARDATWYRRATTVAETTYDAVPAILTGRYPRPDGLPHAIDYPHSLFTLLAGTYEMHTAGVLTQLCPQRLCERDEDGSALERLSGMLSDLTIVYLHLILSADLRDRLPSVTDGWAGFAEEMEAFPGRREKLKHAWGRAPFGWSSRWETGLRFIEGVQAVPRPTLHYLHLMLPHQHFEYLPSGRRYRARRGMPGLTGERFDEERHAEDVENVRQVYQRHLLQVGAVDTWLGRLLAHLEEIGIYDRALIVLTADHGIASGPVSRTGSRPQGRFRISSRCRCSSRPGAEGGPDRRSSDRGRGHPAHRGGAARDRAALGGGRGDRPAAGEEGSGTAAPVAGPRAGELHRCGRGDGRSGETARHAARLRQPGREPVAAGSLGYAGRDRGRCERDGGARARAGQAGRAVRACRRGPRGGARPCVLLVLAECAGDEAEARRIDPTRDPKRYLLPANPHHCQASLGHRRGRPE